MLQRALPTIWAREIDEDHSDARIVAHLARRR